VLGEQEIDGVRTTHYLGRVDFERYLARLPRAQRQRLALSLTRFQSVTQGGTLTPVVDAWVDGDGLVRRFGMTVAVASGAQSATMTMTMDLHDFGKAVAVTLPDASEVADVTQLSG
jgi:hypothetical protein